jgi:hypothetical protein
MNLDKWIKLPFGKDLKLNWVRLYINFLVVAIIFGGMQLTIVAEGKATSSHAFTLSILMSIPFTGLIINPRQIYPKKNN